MRAEFDHYASNYSDLLKDPIREQFAPGAGFFTERKWLLIEEFYRRQRRDMSRDCWLDVGCGRGDLLRLGLRSFREAAGCDVSAAMLAASPDLPIRRQIDPVTLPFNDGSFHFVTAVCVLHHIEPAEQEPVIAELARVLKPGGVVCIIEHNPYNPITQLIVRRSPVDVNAKLLSAGFAQQLLASSGVRAIEHEYFLYLPQRLFATMGFLERTLRMAPLGGQYAVFGRKMDAGFHGGAH
jgi:SAM-dependent methyltransferase